MAQDKPRRWLLWGLVALWLSDWLFDWTTLLGFEDLGFWLWLIGLLVFAYRSVVDTRLPEWLLTWGWMLGVLAVWMIQIAMAPNLTGKDAGFVSSDPRVIAEGWVRS